MAEEVKVSWSTKYIFLTVILSILTGIVGYSLKYFFEKEPKKVISVEEIQTGNLLDLDEGVRSGILANYKLKDKPDEKVQSYFKYSASIRNLGDEGVDSLKVVFDSKGNGLTLIKTPSITSDPKNIMAGLTFVQNMEIKEDNKDEWEISLLNPGEMVKFSYVAYSIHPLSGAIFTVVVRKKDWNIIKAGTEDVSSDVSFLKKPLSQMRGSDILKLMMMTSVFTIAAIMYVLLLKDAPFFRVYRTLISKVSGINESDSEKTRAEIHEFFHERVQGLLVFLEQFRYEINKEIGLYMRIVEKGGEPNIERWETLKSTCDTILGGGNLFKTDVNIEKYLKVNDKLSGLRELRGAIVDGLRRVQEILGSGEKKVNTIHRAEEIVGDIIGHVCEFQKCLGGLL